MSYILVKLVKAFFIPLQNKKTPSRFPKTSSTFLNSSTTFSNVSSTIPQNSWSVFVKDFEVSLLSSHQLSFGCCPRIGQLVLHPFAHDEIGRRWEVWSWTMIGDIFPTWPLDWGTCRCIGLRCSPIRCLPWRMYRWSLHLPWKCSCRCLMLISSAWYNLRWSGWNRCWMECHMNWYLPLGCWQSHWWPVGRIGIACLGWEVSETLPFGLRLCRYTNKVGHSVWCVCFCLFCEGGLCWMSW